MGALLRLRVWVFTCSVMFPGLCRTAKNKGKSGSLVTHIPLSSQLDKYWGVCSGFRVYQNLGHTRWWLS